MAEIYLASEDNWQHCRSSLVFAVVSAEQLCVRDIRDACYRCLVKVLFQVRAALLLQEQLMRKPRHVVTR